MPSSPPDPVAAASAAPASVPAHSGDGVPTRIAYQGEPGSNSDAACREVYPGLNTMPCPTFEDVFIAMTEGEVDLAMIPIENSIAGRVADIHHLLPESKLHIVGEHFMPIHFALMGVPGATEGEITTVRSHSHALSQCRRLIREHAWRPVVADDTAGAAREVAQLGDPRVAALAPDLAAELYGLEVLQREVEDEHHNTTRFLILATGAATPPTDVYPVITSFVFRVRNVPAALYKAMGGFATNGVNMTKLESYQLGGSFSATQFYADVEGHPAERPLALALEELEFYTAYVRILGTYAASPFRAEMIDGG